MNLLKEKITDKNIILSLIPQKPPIVMVDSLLYFDKKKIISGLTITSTNIFVQDGYLTEVGLIENMAQTIALYTGHLFYINKTPTPEGYIGAIKGVSIEKLPKINMQIETEVNVLEEIMGVTLVKGNVRLNDEIIMSAQMKTVLKK